MTDQINQQDFYEFKEEMNRRLKEIVFYLHSVEGRIQPPASTRGSRPHVSPPQWMAATQYVNPNVKFNPPATYVHTSTLREMKESELWCYVPDFAVEEVTEVTGSRTSMSPIPDKVPLSKETLQAIMGVWRMTFDEFVEYERRIARPQDYPCALREAFRRAGVDVEKDG